MAGLPFESFFPGLISGFLLFLSSYHEVFLTPTRDQKGRLGILFSLHFLSP